MEKGILNPIDEHIASITRRSFFGKMAQGIGAAALGSLLNPNPVAASVAALSSKLGSTGLGLPHFAPKAKRVIYLFQNGAPSHVDLFDFKPKLRQWHGRQIPDELAQGKRFSTMTGKQMNRPVIAEISKFAQHGDSGAWVSDFMPETAKVADELCFIKSMYTEQVNHAPAITFFLTGSEQPGRPSMGSWLTYGLGSTSEDLPAFVAMTSRDKEASCGQIFYDYYWGSGFLPTKYQGVKFRGAGDPVLYLQNPDGISRETRRQILNDLEALNQLNLKEYGDPEIRTRIAQYEMAYKMQMSVPELTDFSSEPDHILASFSAEISRRTGDPSGSVPDSRKPLSIAIFVRSRVRLLERLRRREICWLYSLPAWITTWRGFLSARIKVTPMKTAKIGVQISNWTAIERTRSSACLAAAFAASVSRRFFSEAALAMAASRMACSACARASGSSMIPPAGGMHTSVCSSKGMPRLLSSVIVITTCEAKKMPAKFSRHVSNGEDAKRNR